MALLVIIFYADIAHFYTNLPDLHAQLYPVFRFYAFYALLDGNKSVTCGVMRGLSQEISATMASLIGYYLIGFPCELIFAFAMELGVLGLWIG